MTRAKPKTEQTQTQLPKSRRGRRGGRGRKFFAEAPALFRLDVRAFLKIKETADE